jgi:hypothetical protein
LAFTAFSYTSANKLLRGSQDDAQNRIADGMDLADSILPSSLEDLADSFLPNESSIGDYADMILPYLLPIVENFADLNLPYNVSIGDNEAINIILNEVEIDEGVISMEISVSISTGELPFEDLTDLVSIPPSILEVIGDSILPYDVSFGDNEATNIILNKVDLGEGRISMEISINISIEDVASTLGDLADFFSPSDTLNGDDEEI